MKEPELNSERATFSAPPKIMRMAQEKAAARGQKFSTYVANLLAQDVSTDTTSSARHDIIAALAQIYAPHLSAALELQLNHGAKDRPVNQPLVIVRFLDALTSVMSHDFDCEAPFGFISEEEKIVRAALTLAKELNTAGAEQLRAQMRLLNEEAPPQPAKKKPMPPRHPGPTPPVPKAG